MVPKFIKCKEVVNEALPIYFKGGAWDFISEDVGTELLKVSKLEDRSDHTKPALASMSE